MKLRKFLVLGCLLIYGCSKLSNTSTVVSKQPSPIKKSYFVSVPLTKLSSTQCPCFNVEIGSKNLSMELDLGYRGAVTLSESHLEQVSDKTFLREKSIFGIQGREHLTKLYRIPKVTIGKMGFIEPILQESPNEFKREA